MGVINITDKLTYEKPKLQIGEKEYEVNNSMETMLKFEELMSNSTLANMEKAISVTLGEKAVKELDIIKMSMDNFRVISIAIMAAIQGISYEDADTRFQSKSN